MKILSLILPAALFSAALLSSASSLSEAPAIGGYSDAGFALPAPSSSASQAYDGRFLIPLPEHWELIDREFLINCPDRGDGEPIGTVIEVPLERSVTEGS